MSCPSTADWRDLVAHRLDARAAEPAGWPEALAHLGGCPECRRAALTADPTLVFLRLGEGSQRGVLPGSARAQVRDQARDQADIADVQRAVAAMRTASRLDRPRPGRLAAWRRWTAAAVLAQAALSTSGGWQGNLPAGVEASRLAAPATLAEADRLPARLPGMEGLDRPEARVYQVDTVIMVFDEGLDV